MRTGLVSCVAPIFDESDEYSLAEHAPWLSFFIEKKDKPLVTEELFNNALRIAVQLGKTDHFDGYKSGLSAFDLWIKELRHYSVSMGTGEFKHHEVNLTLSNCLLDSRKAAQRYLTAMNAHFKLKNGDLILEGYRKEVDMLTDTQERLLPSFRSSPESWTKEILEEQA